MQIDIEEDGTILVYATSGEKGDAAIAAITALTKDPEVGDEFTGKVVKTTDFGAFVELKKGTDGLLHVSNVGPGRVNHIEDVLSRGDVVDVLVQEVDKARGRIGLKLVQKHENGKIDLAGGARRAGEGRPAARAPRGAPAPRRSAVAEVEAGAVAARAASARDRAANQARQWGAARAAPCSFDECQARRADTRVEPRMHNWVLTELDSGERVISERLDHVRSVAIGYWIGAGSRDETDAKAGRLALHRAPAVQGLEPATRRSRSPRSSTSSAAS